MNKKHLISLAFATLAVTSTVWGIPADPQAKRVRQPDGTYITVMMRGDEHAHLLFSDDGTPLYYNVSTGAFEYASLHGKAIVGSGIVARDAKDRDARAKAYVGKMDRKAIERAAIDNWQLKTSVSMQSNSTVQGPRRLRINDFPTIGKQKSLVILWEFSDEGFTSISQPKEFFTGLLNQPGFTWEGTGINGSARDFYLDASNGLFDPEFTVYGPVKLSHPGNYYGSDSPSQDANIYEAIIESCKALDDEIDFSEYDTDGDGKVDNIYFFYAGQGQADTPNGTELIWPHSWYLGETGWKQHLVLDGVEIDRYTCSNEVRYRADGEKTPNGIGTFVHEFGHVLGLADHYDTSYGMFTFGLGSWDTMASGSYNDDMNTPPTFSAFERAELGWLQFEELTLDADSICVLPNLVESNKAYRVSVDGTNGREFFVMENRQKKGWDKYLPGEGMLMWHIDIDTTAWNNNIVNIDPYHQRVDIVEADGIANDATRPGDAFPGTAGVTQWQLKSWAGNDLLAIDDVTERDGDIRLLLAGTQYQLPAPSKVNISQVADSSFVATWDAVADAKSYVVSAYRIGLEGIREYAMGLDHKAFPSVEDVLVDGLDPDCLYTFDVVAQLASYASDTVSLSVRTQQLAFTKRIPDGLTATDVTSNGFTAHWNAVPFADDYHLTLYRHSYSEATTDMGYDFTNKDNGLPILWTTNSQSYYSVKGYYGAASPSLRFAKTGDQLTVAYPDAKIDALAFWVRSNREGNRILVETSPDYDGETWTVVQTIDAPTTAQTLTVETTGAKRVRLRLELTSGFVAIDDVTASCRVVERTPVAGYNDLSTGGKTEYAINGIAAGETYSFRIQAVNGGERSVRSAEYALTLPVSNGIMPTQTENCDDNKKQYYDLTGIRVQHPQKGGVYIVRQNGRIYKEVLR